MKPPFFVGSRPYRAQSCSGGNGSRRASLFPLHQSRNKAALKQFPVSPLVPWCRDASPLIAPLSFEEACPPRKSTNLPCDHRNLLHPKSRPIRASSQGWQKNRETFAQTRGLIRETPNFFSKSRHLFRHCATFLWNDSTSFAFPRLTLRTPSNASTPSPIVHPQRPLLLCLPSVNSLSTTTAAP